MKIASEILNTKKWEINYDYYEIVFAENQTEKVSNVCWSWF